MANTSYNDIAQSIYLASKDLKSNEETFIKNVINFLKKKNLLSKSKIILNKLETISNTEAGVLVVSLESSVALEEKHKKEIASELKTLYKMDSVIFNEKINEDLLGGFKIEINDEIIDLSISNKLQKLQMYLIK